MNRTDRLDLLARTIRDRPGITSDELARDLGVSVRSVFRDIQHLRHRGYPIEADRGRGGGVRLHRSWGLSRVLLATEEALGTLLSLAVSEKLGFPLFASGLSRARRKVVDAFPSAERRRVAPLRERIFVGQSASAAVRGSYETPSATTMRALQRAFVEQRIFRARYRKGTGDESVRRIEPHAILINWPAWYLLGHDHLRGQTRTYRLDRFVDVTVEDETFVARPRDMAGALMQGGANLPMDQL